ncbi:Rap guanine nucleotide exchange factor 1 [Chelonia mydas]|uniref:CRK SH3-binding GNRP n=1 Tax=Chelonia mydas TaxID=8469 RepID=M7BRD9_CHEMY|nr:Rap guanine nucleotide exchange factor 1 [Chelonia mydas]
MVPVGESCTEPLACLRLGAGPAAGHFWDTACLRINHVAVAEPAFALERHRFKIPYIQLDELLAVGKLWCNNRDLELCRNWREKRYLQTSCNSSIKLFYPDFFPLALKPFERAMSRNTEYPLLCTKRGREVQKFSADILIKCCLQVLNRDSQRSHLSSFTMKLMDKFHSPKIKRTPSKKGKQADLTVKTPEKPVNKNLTWLEEKEKEVVSALRYFKTIVDKMAIDKKVLEMLPGSASKVLEAILPLVQADPRIQQSSAISSCYSRVYQSLGNLIRWSDQVMLEGVNSEDKEMVTTVKGVIKAVLDGVKELVRLTVEKQEHPSPTSPVKPSLPACKSDSPSELPLTDREVEILNKTTSMTQSAEILTDSMDEEVAPPKPPLPCIRVAENSPPPALPPKKRQSAPSPTRVAVVAPMSRATSGSSLPIGINRQDFDADCYAQRRLSGGSHSYGGESPRLSPCSSMGKLSKSDEQLSSLDRDSGQCSRNTSCETLDHYDPDYEFLQQDLSNADQIPQQVPSILSPLPESLGECGSPFHGHVFQLPPGSSPQPQYCSPLTATQSTETPPALPEKKRRSAASQTSDNAGCRFSYERHPSQYDNISEDDLQNPGALSSVPFTSFAAVLPFQQGNSSVPVEFITEFAAPDSMGDPENPPPLPEKKNKHMPSVTVVNLNRMGGQHQSVASKSQIFKVLAYLQFMEDYSEPQPSMFYQTPQNEHIYQQKNKHLMEVYGFNDSFSSTDSSQELAPPPALPPKQRQLQASSAASSFSSVSYCVQQTKVPFIPEDTSATQGLSMSVSNSFLNRHSSFPVHSGCMIWGPTMVRKVGLQTQTLQYKSVFRSYSQDFVPHNQASIPPFLSSTSSSTPPFPPVHQSQSSDLAVPTTASQSPSTVDVPNSSSQESSFNGNAPVCLPSETSFTDSLQTSSSENASEEAGEGEYVNLYSSGQSNGELPHSEGIMQNYKYDKAIAPESKNGGSPALNNNPAKSSSKKGLLICLDLLCLLMGIYSKGPFRGSQVESPAIKDGHPKDSTSHSSTTGKESRDGGERQQKSPDALESSLEEEVDELTLIDHNEIMARLTLKQEGDDGPDVRGGSGDILLVHATETDRKDLVLYCEAFLTTYRTFITPEELIKKLQPTYEKFCHFPDTFKKRVSKNTFFVLVRVVDELCLVELTEEILKLLMDLVFRLVCNGELSLARVLRKNILDKVDQKKMLRYANSIKPLAARGVAARPGTLHDFHSHEIAEQLTLLDAELFYKIEIPEVLLWAKEQNEEKSPNLTQFTEHFNNMSYWVRSIIMLQEKPQDRERLLLKFIKIMKHLRKLNNFNSYLAILSALDSAPIRRLEWQKQTSEGLAEYCTLIDSSSSFRAYRAALAEVEPPCIPYLGLILQDLTFVHLGNPDYIDGKVNFSKRWQQFNILDSMRCFQQIHYDIKRNDDIVTFFNDFSDHLAEEALWELSLKIKPRNITRRKTDREEKT